MLQQILSPLIKIYSFDEIKDKRGIILFDAPLLVEYDMAELVNKDVILITSKNQTEILIKRDKISYSEAVKKITVSNSNDEKKQKLKKENCNVFILQNDFSSRENFSKKIKFFLKEVIQKVEMRLKS